MLKLKRLIMILAVGFILFSMSISAFAFNTVNTEQLGSIQISMHYDNKAVPGGSLTLYRVGTFEETDGQYSFALTDAFTDCNVLLNDDTQLSESAKALYEFAKENSVDGETKEIESDGNVLFDELSVGLYLLVQETAAPGGYEKAEPFLVSVPMEQNGKYVYNVDASPKVELKKEPVTVPDHGESSAGNRLPSTGQLNWPIPILVMLGLLMIIFGGFLYFGKRKTNET